MNVDTAILYLDFVAERHRVWESRQAGAVQPWTDDPILRTRKFTNVYRVLDYGSQFLVRELLDPDLTPRDALARCFLYRYTNLPSTWEHVRAVQGRYPLARDLGQELVDTIIMRREEGEKVFSGAYVILPQPNRTGDKVAQAVTLARTFMTNHAHDFLTAKSQQQRYAILRGLYGVGPFLAMQILTDWGYSAQCGEDRENEFIVPGPGAIKGAKFINPGAKVEDTLRWAYVAVSKTEDHPELTIYCDEHGSISRFPSLMDVQNTLCEFSKYHRFMERPIPNQEWKPAHPGPQPAPVLPSHW